MAIILRLVTENHQIIREIGGLEEQSTDLTYPQHQDYCNQWDQTCRRETLPPQLSMSLDKRSHFLLAEVVMKMLFVLN